MNAVNRVTTSIFDAILPAFEWMGVQATLILLSGIFGIAALLIFKQISWQGGIKGVKDKIKGHLIAIRIYQDDLVLVALSVIRILLRNLQYLGLNFGPILPLIAPFVLVLAQLVVRYGFAPIPVQEPGAHLLPGQATQIEVQLAEGHEDEVEGLEIVLPEGLEALTDLFAIAADGRAFLEVFATEPGAYELELRLADGTVETKQLVAGDEPERLMQPERVSGFWLPWLWPAEPAFAADSPFARVAFAYPDREIAWLPDGPMGVLITFFVASMLFGVAILKPLNIQI